MPKKMTLSQAQIHANNNMEKVLTKAKKARKSNKADAANSVTTTEVVTDLISEL